MRALFGAILIAGGLLMAFTWGLCASMTFGMFNSRPISFSDWMTLIVPIFTGLCVSAVGVWLVISQFRRKPAETDNEGEE